jgi:hypothetical protein
VRELYVRKRIMNQEFRRTHLIQAALQQKGAPITFINTFLDKLKQLAKSPEEFDQWNEKLDHQGIQALTMMLGPQGGVLCDAALDGLFATIAQRYGITRAELDAMSMFN